MLNTGIIIRTICLEAEEQLLEAIIDDNLYCRYTHQECKVLSQDLCSFKANGCCISSRERGRVSGTSSVQDSSYVGMHLAQSTRLHFLS